MFIGLLKVLGVSGEVAELFGGGIEDGTGRNLSHCTFKKYYCYLVLIYSASLSRL